VTIADDALPLTIEVRPGRDVVRQGDVEPGAWIVRAGALFFESVDPEGRRLVLDVLGPGDLVGGLPGIAAEASVRALLGSRLVPAGPVALRDGLARRARRAAWIAASLAWDRIPQRIAVRMDDLAARFGRPVAGGLRIDLPLSHDDIAGLTGTTRESVSRSLAGLARSGRVAGGRGRYVVRPERGSAYPPDWSIASEHDGQ
jgi:CRP/FNR family transcriptional regulator, cyclic AMP receptor protein